MARRPKISNKLGSPDPREGSDGDIQVRQTSLGARIFAKLGGRWFSNKLFGSEIDDPAVSIPKCWSADFETPSGTANTDLVKLPNYIRHENLLSGTVTIFSTTSNNYWLITPMSWSASTSYDGVFRIGSDGASGNLFLSCGGLGTVLQSARGRVGILFK